MLRYTLVLLVISFNLSAAEVKSENENSPKVTKEEQKVVKKSKADIEKELQKNLNNCNEYAADAVETMIEDLEFSKTKSISTDIMENIHDHMGQAYRSIYKACSLKYKPKLK